MGNREDTEREVQRGSFGGSVRMVVEDKLSVAEVSRDYTCRNKPSGIGLRRTRKGSWERSQGQKDEQLRSCTNERD